MAITSVGYDGTVDEKQFESIMGYSSSSLFGVNVGGAFAASSVAGQVLQVRVAAGTAWTAGVADVMDTAATLQVGAPPASGSRWDMIVLRRDYQPVGGTTSLQVIKGTSSKTLPSRATTSGVLTEQPLWLIRVDAGRSTVAEFIDLRVWARNGGCTANHDLVRSYMGLDGTMIEINGLLWQRRIGSNGLSEWALILDSSDTGWIQGTPRSGWGGSNSYIRYRRKSGSVEIRGRINRTSTSEQSVGANGNMENRDFFTLPTGFRPAGASVSLPSGAVGPMAAYAVGSDGLISITAVAPNVRMVQGFESTFSGTYFLD